MQACHYQKCVCLWTFHVEFIECITADCTISVTRNKQWSQYFAKKIQSFYICVVAVCFVLYNITVYLMKSDLWLHEKPNQCVNAAYMCV